MAAQATDAPNVQILRRKLRQNEEIIPRVRVAAYCRISTDKESQLSSLDTQVSVFQERIATHVGWELVDVYADEGLSGYQCDQTCRIPEDDF